MEVPTPRRVTWFKLFTVAEEGWRLEDRKKKKNPLAGEIRTHNHKTFRNIRYKTKVGFNAVILRLPILQSEFCMQASKLFMGHINHFDSNRYNFPSPLLVSNVDYIIILVTYSKMPFVGLEDSTKYYVELN